MKITQKDRILQHLTDFGSITSIEAFAEYGITRLSAIIYRLRNSGFNIVSYTQSNRNRYGDKVHYSRYILQKGE